MGFPTHLHLTSSHQSSYASELTTKTKKVRSSRIAAVELTNGIAIHRAVYAAAVTIVFNDLAKVFCCAPHYL
jgi:acyl carrier protein phosphodiesterase